MTGREAAAYIGRKGMLRLNGFRVEVDVLDAREAYGRIDLLVRPTAGSGEVWKQADTVTFTPKGDK